MIKRTITYKDFNEEEQTEDFYFHLSRADMVQLEANWQGGLQGALTLANRTGDNKVIYGVFKDFIMTAYGIRSADGKRFVKNERLREEFESSEAYSELLMEFFKDPGSAIEFFNKLAPSMDEIPDKPSLEVPVVSEDIAAVPDDERRAQIKAATSENPVAVTASEVVWIDDLQDGLMDGRYTIAR